MPPTPMPVAPAPSQYVMLDLATINSITRNGERLAALGTQVDELKKDAEKTSARMHDFVGHMQQFVIAEQACGKALIEIKDTLRDHTKAITDLTGTKERLLGAWVAIAKFAAVIGVLGGVFLWLLTNGITIAIR